MTTTIVLIMKIIPKNPAFALEKTHSKFYNTKK